MSEFLLYHLLSELLVACSVSLRFGWEASNREML